MKCIFQLMHYPMSEDITSHLSTEEHAFMGFQFEGRNSLHWFSFSNAAATMGPLGEVVSEPASVSRSLQNLRATRCAYAAGAAAFKEKPHFFTIKICI
jgi:hypothetical protein